jgi:hypothetical protein
MGAGCRGVRQCREPGWLRRRVEGLALSEPEETLQAVNYLEVTCWPVNRVMPPVVGTSSPIGHRSLVELEPWGPDNPETFSQR